MDVAQIEELIKVLQDSRTEELSVRCGESTVRIRKGSGHGKPAPAPRKSAKPGHIVPPAPVKESKDAHVLAPMVGIFHKTDGITNIGGKVKEGQVVGVIESMKLLNDVVSEVTGTVVEAMVVDGTPVEYGQPLCRVELA